MPRHLLLLAGIIAMLSACEMADKDVSERSPQTQDKNLTTMQRDSLTAAFDQKKSGNLPGAAAILSELITQPSTSVAAHIELASLYRTMGQSHKAVEVMKQAQQREPGNPRVLANLGYALIANRQSEEAVAIFDELIAMQPSDASAYNAKAVAFDHSGNHVAAQEIYEQALAKDSGSTMVKNNLALSYIMDNKLDEAIKMLEPMADVAGGSATVRQNLALAYGLKGDRARSLAMNLKDVTNEQAQQNLKFYQRYAELRTKAKPSDAAEVMYDFIAAPTAKAAPVDAVSASPSAGQ